MLILKRPYASVLTPLLLCIICHFATAQNPASFSVKNMLPTSPEAAMLGRFGDIPIGYYSGTADISIPLYSIKEAGIEIPIVLQYHSSGIKVEDQASNVGLGWSLEPGGAIIQIVNGAPDGISGDNLNPTVQPVGYLNLKAHGPTGVFYGRGKIGGELLPCDGAQSTNYPDQLSTWGYLQQGYGQPDLYQYSFPGGYSGKFFINPETGIVELLDKKNDITFYRDTNGWIVYTLDGHKFTFTTAETSTTLTPNHTGYTWKLSKIDFNNGKTINFTYADGFYSWAVASESFHSNYPAFNSSVGIVPSGDNSSHNTKNLTQIVTDNEIVRFNWEDRVDLIGRTDNDGDNTNGTLSTKRIKSVDILAKLTLKVIKTFNFSYSYFSYNQVGGSCQPLTNLDALGKRLKLDAIQEIGYDESGSSKQKPPYVFTYNESITLPLKTSYARDFWGYYNGVENTRLLPDPTYFYHAGSFIYGGNGPFNFQGGFNWYYHPYSISFQSSEMDPVWDGAERSTHKSKILAGMLTKITYPTGGYTQFEYEPNSFSNYDYPDLDKIQLTWRPVNMSDMNAAPDPNPSYRFHLNRQVCIRFTNTISQGDPAQGLNFYDLSPSTITLKKIVGSTTTVIKTWQMSTTDKAQYDVANGNFVWKDYITFDYDPNADYIIEPRLSDALPAQIPTQGKSAYVNVFFEFYDVPISQNVISYGAGVRVASVKNYNENGIVSSTKVIKYVKDDLTTSGILMSPLTLVSCSRMMFINYIGVDFWYTEADIWHAYSESATPYSNSVGGVSVGYSRVEVLDLDKNGIANGKQVFYYQNLPNETMAGMPDNPNLLNGLIQKEEIFDISNALKKSTTFDYIQKSHSFFSGARAEQRCISDFPCTGGSFYALPDYAVYFSFYPINSSWYVLSAKHTVDNFGTQSALTDESYSYNDLGQLVSSSSKNSKSKNIYNHFSYPYDVPAGPNDIEHLLVINRLYNALLEKETTVDSKSVSRTVFGYRQDGGINDQLHLVQNNIQQSFGSALKTEVDFETYGSFKKPVQLRQMGIAISLLWTLSGSSVIAQAINTTVDQVAFSSFEDDEGLSWTYLSAGINSTYKRTGLKCFSLTPSQTLSKASLTALTKYIVSYWSKNPSAYTIAGSMTVVQGQTINGWTYFEHTVTNQTTITISGTGYIDEVRLYPQGSHMTTYTILPLRGISSITDPNNVTSFYEYDELGRLIVNKDTNLDILQKVEYNYQLR